MRRAGIEPALQPWKSCILPLNYQRKQDGPTENRTPVSGFKAQSLNHWTIGPPNSLGGEALGLNFSFPELQNLKSK